MDSDAADTTTDTPSETTEAAPPEKSSDLNHEKQKEHLARGIRADRNADDPQHSLLNALGDYMVLCGGDPVDDQWRVEMKMRTNGGTAGSFDVYYYNPDGVRFRSRAEAVRHYGLVPIAAPKNASRSQPGGAGSGAGTKRKAETQIERKPGETLAQVKARRDTAEVGKVMDRLLQKVEHLSKVSLNAAARDTARAKVRAEKDSLNAEEKAVKEQKRLAEKQERDAVRSAERAEKDARIAGAEQIRLQKKEKEAAEKTQKAAERFAEKLERDKAKDNEKGRKDAVRVARERRKVEDAEGAVREVAELKTKGRWLRQSDSVRVDGWESSDAPPGPDTPQLAFTKKQDSRVNGLDGKALTRDGNATTIPESLLISNPPFAGDAFEVWSFLDRFKDVLFAEDFEAVEQRRKAEEKKNAKKPGQKKGKKSKKAKAVAAAAAAERARDTRAPSGCAPPTPEALALCAVSGDETAAAAIAGALLAPLIAAHASASNSEAWREATGMAPWRDAFYLVDNGGGSVGGVIGVESGTGKQSATPKLQSGDVAWQELLRRYFRGAAAAMQCPPEGGLLGSTARAGADAGETVCRWITTGGPTCVSTLPETGTVLPPACAAALAADLELVPRPPAALSAKADAEALALCEAELFALGGGVFESGGTGGGAGDTDTATQAKQKQADRRAYAMRVIAEAHHAPGTDAVRQTVRVLAHQQINRPPPLSRNAIRNISDAQESSVPTYASVAGGAGFVLAARGKQTRVVDYETIDARAHAGVYAVAALNSRGGEFDLLRENAQECGEFLKAAGADKTTPRTVSTKIEKAWKRGVPENDFPEEDPVLGDADAVDADDTKDADGDTKEKKKSVGRPRLHPLPEEIAPPKYVTINGGTYTLFGPRGSSLPKVAWDDGCLCCGGDTFGGAIVLLCEQCDGEYHAQCLSPALRDVPEDDWFCPSCARRQGESEETQKVTSPNQLRALDGTRLAVESSGALTAASGSTRARTTQARRNLRFAEMLTEKGGWSGMTPVDRLSLFKELTWHLLECSTIRSSLDESERKATEAKEALRRHVRDWPSFRKHGVSQHDANALATAARAVAETKEEALEAVDLAAKAAKKVERDAKEAARKAASGGEGKDDAGDDEPDEDKCDDEMEEDDEDDDGTNEDGANDEDGRPESKEDSKKTRTGPQKSYRVRMAGAEAARVCLPSIPEDEGRARWQHRWHELERVLRANDSRLETLGVDRNGDAYWMVGPWGLLVTQRSGFDAGAVASKPLGPGATPGKKRKRPSKSAKGQGGDKELQDGDKGEEEDDDDEDEAKTTAAGEDPDETLRRLNLQSNVVPGGGKDVKESPWGLYEGPAEVRTLLEKLDKDGRFEQSLWTQLERRFGAPVFETEKPDEKDEDALRELEEKSDDEEAGGDEEEDEEDAVVVDASDDITSNAVPVTDLAQVPSAPSGRWKKLTLERSSHESVSQDATAVAANALAMTKNILLSLEASVPNSTTANETSQIAGYTKAGGCSLRREAWRVMVVGATNATQLAMASTLLEHGLRRECFKPEWLLWSSPAPALRSAASDDAVAAAASVLLRARVLRNAVHWPSVKKTTVARTFGHADSPSAQPVERLSREERAKQRENAANAGAMAAAMAASAADTGHGEQKELDTGMFSR